MGLPHVLPEDARQRVQQVRRTILDLHKALLDSERSSYELVHGAIGSPGAFLQLLINDPWFSWLQPVTNLIVQMDETLASKKPVDGRIWVQLLEDTRALLSPSRESSEFWRRYEQAIRRDPGVSVLHERLDQELATHLP